MTVASESDIEQTVRIFIVIKEKIFCQQDMLRKARYNAQFHKLKFLAQGGHGFTTTYYIWHSDVVIDLRGQHKTIVNAEEGTAIIEAGALNGEVIKEAHKAKTHIGI